MKAKATNFEYYFSQFPSEVQEKLQLIRTTIAQICPKATEKISYGMPAFYFQENIVYFAAYKNHIGFYPTSSGIKNFQTEISIYKNSKGAVQFPLDKPLPLALIKKITKFRLKEVKTKHKKQKNE